MGDCIKKLLLPKIAKITIAKTNGELLLNDCLLLVMLIHPAGVDAWFELYSVLGYVQRAAPYSRDGLIRSVWIGLRTAIVQMGQEVRPAGRPISRPCEFGPCS
jgi:hypothetical protein